MPFKSEAQKKKLALLVKEGKFSKEKYREWESKTPEKKLPERVRKAEKPGSDKVKISKVKVI